MKTIHTYLLSWKSTRSPGFTLLEMMIFFAVFGILSAIAFVAVQGYHARARDTIRVTDLRKINQALDGYFTAKGSYPGTACGTTGMDCTHIDATTFITSAQSEWSSKVIAFEERRGEDIIGGILDGNFPHGKLLMSYLMSNLIVDPLESLFIAPVQADYTLGPAGLEKELKIYLGDGILPIDPVNTGGTYPWENKKAHVYSYGNVGSLPGQEGYDLTTSLETPTNPLACFNRLARYGYNNSVFCNQGDSSAIEVVNTSFSGTYHGLIYEAGVRKGKYELIQNEDAINYYWKTGNWAYTGGTTPICGGYSETRSVTCARKNDNVDVAENLCASMAKPTGVNPITQPACTIVSNCTGLPTNAVWNTVSAITQTYNGSIYTPTLVGAYNTTASTTNCRYTAASGYHTEDSGITFVSNTRACVITNGNGSQTWGGSSWGTCTPTSCNGGYTIVGNACLQIINGTCNATFNSLTTPTPTCASGNPTAISGSGPWTWGCTGVNGGTSTAANACSANLTIHGSCNNSVALGCTTGTSQSDNGAVACGTTRTWYCGGIHGGNTSVQCSRANPACINGACNATFNSLTTPTPTCASGNPTAVVGSGPWTWGCNSPNGGTNTAANACIANRTVNGSCNATFNSLTTPTPTCASGTPTAISGSGPWTWGCTGANGGTSTVANACSANLTVNGVCNNATQFACSAGTSISNVAGSCGGSSTWSCQGLYGGTTVTTCTKTNAACPTATCNNSVALGCTTGTSQSDNGAVACGTTRTWYCGGSGYTTSVQCSLANPSCSVAGTCGTANGQAYAYNIASYSPDTQCGAGNGIASNTSFPTQGGSVTWTCGGSGGGASSPTCSASRANAPVNGVCGSANGASSLRYTWDYFAVAGPCIGSDPYNPGWVCNSSYIASLQRCNNLYNPSVTTINVLNDVSASCTKINGPPNTNLCTSGTPSAVSGSGPYTWTCIGQNGGINSGICSTTGANSPAQCGSVYMTCTTGNVEYWETDTSWCGGNWSWTCRNGASSVMCHAASGCRYLGGSVLTNSNPFCAYGGCGGSAKAVGTPCQYNHTYSIYSGTWKEYTQYCN